MSVPYQNLVSTSGKKAVHSGVDLAGEQLAHLRVLGFGLLLAANSADTFRIGDQEDSLGLRPCRMAKEDDEGEL